MMRCQGRLLELVKQERSSKLTRGSGLETREHSYWEALKGRCRKNEGVEGGLATADGERWSGGL